VSRADDAAPQEQPQERPASDAPAPEMLEATFRNGSITTVGIVLGFSLSFVSAWASSPLPWSRSDGFVVLPLVLGIALQCYAMAELFSPRSLILVVHERARRAFLSGLVLVAAGIATALLLDVLGYGQRNLLR
jgi:hypothetical protein